MTSIRYRPEIDGLRALAIIPVLLFHLGVGWMRGGFLGVDVFFVVSGFLITSIILKDYERGSFTFTGFWMRRVRRIMPVLVSMVAATLMAGRFLLYSPDIANLGKQGLAALLSFSNINFWLHAGSYWGEQAENSAFLHTWSLSVEEQFYLLFPLSLFLLLKYFQKRLILVSLLLSCASLLAYVYGALHYASATFYLLPTRVWELGCGCVLAMLNHRHPTMLRNNALLSLIGLGAIMIAYVFIRDSGGSPPFLILSVAGAGLIIAFARDPHNPVNRVLSAPPVVYVGKISYSLYIWHWPVWVLSKNLTAGGHPALPRLGSVALMFACAMVSYHVIEKFTRQNRRAVPYILAAFLASLAYAWHLSVADLREDLSLFGMTTWNGQLYNAAPRMEMPDDIQKRMDGIRMPMPNDRPEMAYARGGIQHLYGQATPEIVLLGDSHALMWAGLLDEIAEEHALSISFYAADGTPVFFDIPVRDRGQATLFFDAKEKRAFDLGRLTALREWKPKAVIIASCWFGGRDMQECRDLLEFLGEIGSAVFLLEDPPALFFGDKNAPRYLSYMGLKPNGGRQYISDWDSEPYRSGRNLIRQMADAYPHCRVIPIADVFLNGSKVWVLDGPDVLYIDDDHLSHQGALRAKPVILRELQSCFANQAPQPAGSPPRATGK